MNNKLTYEQFADKWFEYHSDLYTELLKKISAEQNEYYESIQDTHSVFCTFYFDGDQHTFSTYKWDSNAMNAGVIYQKDIQVVQEIASKLISISNKHQEQFDQWKRDWTLYQQDEYSFEEDNTIDEDKKTEKTDASVDEKISSMPESEKVETVKGIQFNADGSYVLKQSKTLAQMMRMFMQWWELVQSLVRSADNPDGTTVLKTFTGESVTIQNSSTFGKGPSDIISNLQASVVINSAFDYAGHAMREGLICPVCHNKVHSLKIGGFCSTECAMKFVMKMAAPFELTPSEAYREFYETLDKITGILDHTSLILNALTGIPNILRDLATIPEPYKSYVQVKINEGFCMLYASIQKLMIKKTELIKKMMKPVKLGFIKKPLKVIFGAVEIILNAMEYAQMAFDMAYMYVYQVIDKIKIPLGPNLGLSGESYGWLLTPRSFMSPMPYTCPDATKVIVELPGGSGPQKIEAIKAAMPSGMQNINFQAIDETVRKLFPPLTPLDYYLEPELFQVRYLFSDQSNIVLQIRQQLEDMMTYGLDYIPKFENLLPVKQFTFGETNVWLPNLGYVWFVLALMDGWGPHSQALTGSLLNPAI